MIFELKPKNPCEAEMFNADAWPAIWRWLCDEFALRGGVLPLHARRVGQFNDGLALNAEHAEAFANIIVTRGKWCAYAAPIELDIGDRAERLVKFFRECGGFEIW